MYIYGHLYQFGDISHNIYTLRIHNMQLDLGFPPLYSARRQYTVHCPLSTVHCPNFHLHFIVQVVCNKPQPDNGSGVTKVHRKRL